ncbi:hypothetical protein J6590_012498 [Homalodisca vitripennis]|nr:hypothetical protein J6590_012498 [Homalodisca vitripennis]
MYELINIYKVSQSQQVQFLQEWRGTVRTEAECLGKSERKELELDHTRGFASLKLYNCQRTEAECLLMSERKELELDHTRGFC